jgi:hypothetical protein
MNDETVDDNKKYYFGLIPTDETSIILKKVVAQGESNILIWTQRERKSLAETYELIKFSSKERTLFFRPPGKLISTFKKSKKINEEIFFRITLGRFYFFSTATLEYNKDLKEYSIKIKNPLYKGQQRGDYRIKSSEWATITIKLEKKDIACADLSSGGICFEILKKDAEKYPKEKSYFNCTLVFNGTKYIINRLKIASTWPNKEDDKKIFIGISFIDIPGQTEEDLFKQINVTSKEIEEREKRLAERNMV